MPLFQANFSKVEIASRLHPSQSPIGPQTHLALSASDLVFEWNHLSTEHETEFFMRIHNDARVAFTEATKLDLFRAKPPLHFLVDGRGSGHLGPAVGLKTLSIHVCVCPHFRM